MNIQGNRNILKNLMENININNLYNLSYNSNMFAARFRNGKRATGRGLMQQIIYQEARRLQMISNHYVIIMATKRIWHRSTRSQRQIFIDSAHEINRINDRNRRRIMDVNVNADTLNRISQINIQQVDTTFEKDIYNGVQFDQVDLFLPWEFPESAFP
ncbi:hypothetical protein RhiirA4_471204 [Rhizophagus irregularis]|uniref:Uncharacterized protein n=1 Tax=Rhizophagus irregularis TaxID=588596 RepID=A0A2I1H2V4_9GLOM|nr:hypothetical protein RhiirA4_471204 [Rhizophagus irregularis]